MVKEPFYCREGESDGGMPLSCFQSRGRRPAPSTTRQPGRATPVHRHLQGAASETTAAASSDVGGVAATGDETVALAEGPSNWGVARCGARERGSWASRHHAFGTHSWICVASWLADQVQSLPC